MDKEWESLILVVAGIGAAFYFLPRLLPEAAAWVVARLLSWQVVVPAGDAVLRIPTTDVGFDLARLLIGAGALVLLAVLVRSQVRSRAQA